ncbi:lactococcin 972 family bacteriocin [Antribacter gilvus]|uniref:lactococcin 972 family bacteriocin n=1 Tax=Antribacter gilvus TaxID=2304675 RepID=UPI000F79E474|nr:lactococcin 972 family bacteriocin [Antribacter gilvus]
MNRTTFRRTLASTAVAATLIAGGTTVAVAAVTYVGGGTWERGSSTTVWSNYFHGTRCHGSSVQGTYYDSDSRPAGQWTLASAPTRWWAVDNAYWGYC